MLASELIRDSYQEIGKVASQQPITGDETATAIRYLNNLMYSKAHIIVDYTVVASASDEITTPDVFNMWMVKALAIKLSTQFGQLESYMALKEDESEAWQSVLIQLSRIPAPQLNGNVPYGSGNKMPGSYTGSYYTESDNGVLTEQNGTIVVEDDT
jgi:hypothetical protein